MSGEARAALVTGASSGIGAAIATRLEDDGWDVLSVDVRGDVGFQADLTTRAGNSDAVAAAVERFGRLDAVIPNAGFQHVAPIEEFPEDRWDAIIALLLTSPFLLARHAWPHLRESGAGRFVAIASVHGLVASPYKAVYIRPSTASSASSRPGRVGRAPGRGEDDLLEHSVLGHAVGLGLVADLTFDERSAYVGGTYGGMRSRTSKRRDPTNTSKRQRQKTSQPATTAASSAHFGTNMSPFRSPPPARTDSDRENVTRA